MLRAKLYLDGKSVAGLDYHGANAKGGIEVGYHWDLYPPLGGEGDRKWFCSSFHDLREGVEALAKEWNIVFLSENQVSLPWR